MNEALAYAKMFAELPLALRRFARRRLSLDEAKDIIRERMAHREERFLHMLASNIYGYPASPYLPMLEMAGCEMGDLRQMVKRRGLEDTLRSLRNAGVYVTFEEFKGRKPMTRDGRKIAVTPRDFDNPFARRHFAFQTGGSTGVASSVAVDLDHIAERAPHDAVTLAAHGLRGVPSALWRGIIPDSTLGAILRRAYVGELPVRWFSHLGWRDSKHWLKYGAASCYVILLTRLLGMPMPLPEPTYVDQAAVVARWMSEMLKTYGQCLLYTNVSRGVRLCLAAEEAGLDLRGATIKGGGEPATSAKVRQFERAGVRYVSNYAMREAGSLASGCARPADGSDVHLFKDAYALITHPYEVNEAGVTLPAFNLTALLPTAPKVMLNVQMDDCGIVEERHCGCELESYGYTTHLRQIRSYSKLTGEGVTLIGTEMVRILEEVLPARFGGTPLDYQMMEQEDTDGFTRLYLVISPRVEISDEAAVVSALLQTLRESSAMADAARTVWQDARTIRVRRTEPVWTDFGKLAPLWSEGRTVGSKRESEEDG